MAELPAASSAKLAEWYGKLKDQRESASLVISLSALVISFLGLYHQAVYESSRLSMHLMEFSWQPRTDSSPTIITARSNHRNRATSCSMSASFLPDFLVLPTRRCPSDSEI
jgi:hypothetical protein